MNKLTNLMTREAARFTNFLELGRNHRSKLIGSVFALMLCLSPMAAFAQTTFGDSAATEVAKVTPQVTTVGLAIIAVIAVIVTAYVVMRMMKKV